MPRHGTRWACTPETRWWWRAPPGAILGVTWLVYMLPVVFFLLGYFLSAGLTEGWRYAIAVVAVVLSFVPIKLYDGYARKKDTLTYTIVREF